MQYNKTIETNVYFTHAYRNKGGSAGYIKIYISFQKDYGHKNDNCPTVTSDDE